MRKKKREKDSRKEVWCTLIETNRSTTKNDSRLIKQKQQTNETSHNHNERNQENISTTHGQHKQEEKSKWERHWYNRQTRIWKGESRRKKKTSKQANHESGQKQNEGKEKTSINSSSAYIRREKEAGKRNRQTRIESLTLKLWSCFISIVWCCGVQSLKMIIIKCLMWYDLFLQFLERVRLPVPSLSTRLRHASSSPSSSSFSSSFSSASLALICSGQYPLASSMSLLLSLLLFLRVDFTVKQQSFLVWLCRLTSTIKSKICANGK